MTESPATPGPRTVEIAAPAKVNLGLRILGRRADGYHLLESLFVPVDLADHLRVEIAPGPTPPDGPRIELVLDCQSPIQDALPIDSRNLAVRAARAFFRACAERSPAVDPQVSAVRLELGKHIPIAAGLGGGSSDAAAVLTALCRLLPAAIPEGDSTPGSRADELSRIALSLGADVPFFLTPQPAVVTGIGERMTPFPSLPRLDILLVSPGISVATAAVYELYDEIAAHVAEPLAALTPAEPGPTMRAPLGPGGDSSAYESGRREYESGSKEYESGSNELVDLLAVANDLEAPAIRLCPAVAVLLDRLRALGAVGAGMSGSGPTVWGVFERTSLAEKARAAFVEDPAAATEKEGTKEQQAHVAPRKELSGQIWLRVVRSLDA